MPFFQPDIGTFDPRPPFAGRGAFGLEPAVSVLGVDSFYDQVVLADLPSQGWYWKFNEIAGTTLFDRGPNNLDLTLAGGNSTVNAYIGPTPSYASTYGATPYGAGTYGMDPNPNLAVYFDGNGNSSAAATRGIIFGANAPFSVEYWIFPRPNGSGQKNIHVLGNYNLDAPVGGWNTRYLDDGTLRLQRLDVAGAADSISAGVPREVWSHIIYTYNGTNMNMYRNGALVAGPTASSRLIPDNIAAVFTIGNYRVGGSGSSYTGYLARPAVYGSALSAGQVLTHFLAGVATTWSPDLTPTGTPTRLGQIPGRPIYTLPTDWVASAALFLQELDVTVTSTPTVQIQVNKILNPTVTTTATFQKQVNKILAPTVTTTPTMQKQVNKILSVTVTTTASIQKLVKKVFSVTVTTTADLATLFIAGGGAVVSRLRTMMGIGE